MNFSEPCDSRFWSGDWGGFNQTNIYDIILTSETIYNVDNYGKLHRLFKRNLKPGGTMYPYSICIIIILKNDERMLCCSQTCLIGQNLRTMILLYCLEPLWNLFFQIIS